jgi:hypothetical protein
MTKTILFSRPSPRLLGLAGNKSRFEQQISADPVAFILPGLLDRRSEWNTSVSL